MNRREAIGGVGASLLIAGLPLAPTSQAQGALQWPTGSSGAISVSYDDGLDCHLDLATPALEQRGMAGTFYVTMKNMAATARTSEGNPNRPETALRRPHRLQALAVGYDAGDVAAVLDYLQLAVLHGHWAILVFHEIVPVVVEEGQVSTAMHEQVLDTIASLPLWCAPVGRVFDHLALHAAPGSVTGVSI